MQSQMSESEGREVLIEGATKRRVRYLQVVRIPHPAPHLLMPHLLPLGALHIKSSGEAQRPPESGGQHDRDEVEIVRGEVPKPPPYKVCLGTSSRATLSGRAALLT